MRRGDAPGAGRREMRLPPLAGDALGGWARQVAAESRAAMVSGKGRRDPGRGRAPLLGPRGSGQHAAWMASGGKVASRHIIADAGATGFNSGIEAGTEVACNQIEVVIDGALSVCSDSHT